MFPASQTAPERSLLERSLLGRWRAATARPDGVWLDDSLADLPPSGSVERVMVLHALVARVQALEVTALAEVARHLGGEPAPCGRADGSWAVPARATVGPAVVDEVAPAPCLGRESARRRIAEAEQPVRCLPRTHRLLTDGLVDLAVARVVTDETASLTETAADRVDSALGDALTRRAQDRSRCDDVDPYADLVAVTGSAAPFPALLPLALTIPVLAPRRPPVPWEPSAGR